MNKILKYLSSLDWILSIGTLVYGIGAGNTWIAGAGLVGMAVAWYRPAYRIKAAMERKFLAKKKTISDAQKAMAEDAFYSQVLGSASADPAPAVPEQEQSATVDFSRSPAGGAFYLSASRHNVVQYRHLNLAGAHKGEWA